MRRGYLPLRLDLSRKAIPWMGKGSALEQLQLPAKTIQQRPTGWQKALIFASVAVCLVLFGILTPMYISWASESFLFSSATVETRLVFGQLTYDPPPCDIQPAWSSWTALFDINARTGSMSFTTAKLIDITWDLVVGRGGQALLAWISYKVFTQALMRIAEERLVPHKLFASLALGSLSWAGISTIVHAVFRVRGWRGTMALAWMALAASYVLAFPTLLSASTSYVAALETSVRLVDNSTAPWIPFIDTVSYIFYNTSRLNVPDPWVVPARKMSNVSGTFDICHIIYYEPYFPGVAGSYTSFTVNDTEYDVGYSARECSFYYNGNFYPVVFMYSPDTGPDYAIPTVAHDQIVCTPIGQDYRWGFSLELVFLTVMAQMVWFLGMYAMWIDAQRNSLLVRTGRDMGTWRAILDLAETLRADLGCMTCMYGDKELEKRIGRLKPVKYHSSDGQVEDEEREDTEEVAHLGLRSYSRSSDADDEAQTASSMGKLKIEWGKRYGWTRRGEKDV